MNAYNKDEFCTLLRRAIGNRTAKEFAKESGLSEFQISRRFTGHQTSSPRKCTLKAIAAASGGAVSYQELLCACGYTVPAKEEPTDPPAPDIEKKLAKAALLSAIGDRHVPCAVSSRHAQIPCDFELLVGDGQQVRWSFCCLSDEGVSYQIEQAIHSHYLDLMYRRLDAYSKASFITGRADVYETCTRHQPANLNANVSVILYSRDTLDIVCEQELARSVTDPLPDYAAVLSR